MRYPPSISYCGFSAFSNGPVAAVAVAAVPVAAVPVAAVAVAAVAVAAVAVAAVAVAAVAVAAVPVAAVAVAAVAVAAVAVAAVAVAAVPVAAVAVAAVPVAAVAVAAVAVAAVAKPRIILASIFQRGYLVAGKLPDNADVISDALCAVGLDFADCFDIADTAPALIVLIAISQFFAKMETPIAKTDITVTLVFLAYLVLHAAACEVGIKCFVAFHDYLLKIYVYSSQLLTVASPRFLFPTPTSHFSKVPLSSIGQRTMIELGALPPDGASSLTTASFGS